MKTRGIIYWGVTLGVLAFLNWMIFEKEKVIRDGTQVLLKLAPVDPRSLMQGDYMILRYAILDPISDDLRKNSHKEGRIVVQLDDRNIATFVRMHTGEPLQSGEQLLKYRLKKNAISLGAESFFFQEGEAAQFQNAQYGELKVAADGSSILVGLRDENLKSLARAIETE